MFDNYNDNQQFWRMYQQVRLVTSIKRLNGSKHLYVPDITKEEQQT